MSPAKRQEIFTRFRAAKPHPKTELVHRTPFELLVAVILSAQATDVSVNAATKNLFPVANTPQALLDLGEEKLREYVQRIGLYKAKSKNIIEACKLLVEKHGGKVPQTREELEALPGVGRKTANVILNTAFGQPTIAVDTHIFRIANRIGLAPGKTVWEEISGGEETLVVVSSDLSHYLPYDAARARDRNTAEAILRLESRLDPEEACGAAPINESRTTSERTVST